MSRSVSASLGLLLNPFAIELTPQLVRSAVLIESVKLEKFVSGVSSLSTRTCCHFSLNLTLSLYIDAHCRLCCSIEENMLKKANQKRRLDEMVIAEGDFTTDYLQKLDWRDYLDDGQLEELGVDAANDQEAEGKEGKAGGTALQSAAEIRQALAAAEDEEDAAAAKAAVAEMEVDRSDFAGDGQGASTVTKDGLVRTNGDGAPEAEEEDDPLKGTVDGFMVNFVEDNWELFD